ncbi:hypothetical protein DPEC_G00344440 [Dallia pectoralis]|uniref:Uncharacterized protein n=1 Tax=Dallia pectoralis TaxID=75939 RepID=A0ACC2F3B4_DALPE|nr:hypothetical protein DPEC_G00344440 [Dallia pectoralis]
MSLKFEAISVGAGTYWGPVRLASSPPIPPAPSLPRCPAPPLLLPFLGNIGRGFFPELRSRWRLQRSPSCFLLYRSSSFLGRRSLKTEGRGERKEKPEGPLFINVT